MKKYILLLRGINVGGRNILPMKDLKSLLEKYGYEDVRTYIQSGNVVLNGSKKPGKNISTAIEEKFGFSPQLMVLEESQFELAVKNNPYRAEEGKTIHFYFTEKAPKPDIEKLNDIVGKTEKYELKGKVFYLHAPDGVARSKLVASIDKCLGVPATGRNLNTISKLAEML